MNLGNTLAKRVAWDVLAKSLASGTFATMLAQMPLVKGNLFR